MRNFFVTTDRINLVLSTCNHIKCICKMSLINFNLMSGRISIRITTDRFWALFQGCALCNCAFQWSVKRKLTGCELVPFIPERSSSAHLIEHLEWMSVLLKFYNRDFKHVIAGLRHAFGTEDYYEQKSSLAFILRFHWPKMNGKLPKAELGRLLILILVQFDRDAKIRSVNSSLP